CLVKEMCTAWIEGPNLIQQSGTYTWRIRQAASPGPFAYQWGSGETTETITRYVSVYPGMPESAFLLSMSIRDTRNGRTRTDNRRPGAPRPLCRHQRANTRHGGARHAHTPPANR